jgi:hypothetical protein
MSQTPRGASGPSRGASGRIVAELGRPETPDETAERKAESSSKHRANQTLRNLILALAASLGVVLFLVLVVVRPTSIATPTVDYHQLAADTQSAVSVPLADPTLSSAWKANDASFVQGNDGVRSWYIGFITPQTQFIGLKQGIDANPTWVSNQLNQAKLSGTVTIAGITWKVYDQRSATNTGNFAYSLSTTVGASTYLLYGSATTPEFRTVATALASQLSGVRGK